MATELRRLLGDEHDILLIDRRETFLAGLRKLWALFGLGTLEEGERRRDTLTERRIPFLRREVREIEPSRRHVVTEDGMFDGRGYCFIEMGKSAATRVEGNFFAKPEPEVRVRDVSEAYAQEKRRFEAELLERWFGR